LDKSRILILAVGISALVAFSVYTFSEIFSSNVPGGGTQIQPIGSSSLTSTLTKTNSSLPPKGETNAPHGNATDTALSIFENRDKPENHYSIQFPSDATVVHGDRAGSYLASTKYGTFTSALEDIPDNTSVQLYVLTHDEPKLKSSLDNYTRVSIDENTVSGHRAWNLIYTWQNATSTMKSARTYVEGRDQAMVIEYTALSEVFAKNNPTIKSVANSFQWIDAA